MKRLCRIVLCFPVIISCSTLKEIPVQTIEKEIIRDSLIYIRDTVEVPVPYEKIVEVLPKDTTSILRTSVAQSEAKIEKGMLHHRLEQNGVVKAQIDTFYLTKTVEKIVEKEIPIEIEIEKKVIPNWCWISLVINIVILLLMAFKIYLKFKKVL